MLSLYHSKGILATCWNYFFDFNDTQSKEFVQKGILVCCDIFLQCRSIFFNKTIVFAEPTRRPSSSVGPPVEYLLETFSGFEVISMLVQGDGNCAKVQWEFLFISMPGWVLVIFLALIAITAFQLKRP